MRTPGYVLAIDQASRLAGASLWLNGQYVAGAALSGGKSDSYSKRLVEMQENLTRFLDAHLPPKVKVTRVIFEGVHQRLVLVTVGAFLCSPRVDAKMHAKHTFVESSQWKSWAKKNGAHSQPFREIKGVTALRETGFPVTPDMTDDVCDSVMIFKSWEARP